MMQIRAAMYYSYNCTAQISTNTNVNANIALYSSFKQTKLYWQGQRCRTCQWQNKYANKTNHVNQYGPYTSIASSA